VLRLLCAPTHRFSAAALELFHMAALVPVDATCHTPQTAKKVDNLKQAAHALCNPKHNSHARNGRSFDLEPGGLNRELQRCIGVASGAKIKTTVMVTVMVLVMVGMRGKFTWKL
jgi:hypothetical protein